ncbi:MAG: hypothetical protein BAJATHORv1_50039 [Candidatus Thorarchaeota archaeon]|nr:MAG: hypothetical protein BAJATHORv1_50039 [Candidatus Thorarchaeota archaeon]
MEGIQDKKQVDKSLSYNIPDSVVVFRIAWFIVASRPGAILNEYSEAESQIFKGKAIFSVKYNDHPINVRVWVEEAQTSVELTAWGDDEALLENYLDETASALKNAIEKYASLEEPNKIKLRKALVAKTCWDRLIFEILNKAPQSAVYIQVAHGREMSIKATEGEEMHPLTLTTSGWLSKIEDLPSDEPLPSEIATELAKKSVEWKKETHEIIRKYL